MTVVGVDPGLSGALVAVEGSRVVSLLDMPTIPIGTKRKVDAYAIVSWLTELGPVDHVVLEDVGTMPGQGIVSAFNFGLGVGVIQGVLTSLARPWSTVRPQVWTRVLGVGADKGVHRLHAQRLFPESADLFSRVKDDGRADGALMAHWWSRVRD